MSADAELTLEADDSAQFAGVKFSSSALVGERYATAAARLVIGPALGALDNARIACRAHWQPAAPARSAANYQGQSSITPPPGNGPSGVKDNPANNNNEMIESPRLVYLPAAAPSSGKRQHPNNNEPSFVPLPPLSLSPSPSPQQQPQPQQPLTKWIGLKLNRKYRGTDLHQTANHLPAGARGISFQIILLLPRACPPADR